MYVRQRSVQQQSFRATEVDQNGLRKREVGEEEEEEEEGQRSSGSGEGESGGEEEKVPMRRQPQRAADQRSLLTRAVESVFKLVKVAEFEILFITFFVIVVLLFKDLVRCIALLSLITKVKLFLGLYVAGGQFLFVIGAPSSLFRS